MRLWLVVAFALHVAAVLALVRYGSPRPIDEAAYEPAGITVVFSRGGGGETVGEEDAETPPETAAAPPEQTPEAPGEQQAEAQPEPAVPEEVTAEAEPEPAPARPADAPPPAAVSALPLPPPPPPEPPPQATEARTPPQSPASAEGHQATRTPERSETEQESAPQLGSAGFLFATRPSSVGYRVDPVVPVEARQLRMQGRVELVVTISPEGIPTEVDVFRSSGHFLLDRAAEEALWQWRFDPARRGGIPVEEKIVIPFTFRIVN